MELKLKSLQEKLKIKLKNKTLLIKAITHKSFDPHNNYEKLEFLGDRVLGLVISKKLIELYPEEKVGILDKKYSFLVNKDRCLEIGKKLNLDKYILVGNVKKNKTKIENKIISDCCESIIGSIYLDSGFEIAKKFILNNWKNFLEKSNITIIDSKTMLQEYSLKHFKILPVYKVFSTTGPKHNPEFKVGVKLKNTKYIIAKGSSKKNAQQLAASEILKSLYK
tara:strand:- start:276 stop:941 length:666 start_codon:yes stop_codon:yes gene_type:complete